jgi:threonine/homoserine/homoserine lactone efflux protein
MKLLGIAAGFGIQVVATGGGLGMVQARWPQLDIDLQWLGIGCASYLGWKLLRSRHAGTGGGGELLTFGEVAALQLLNPAAWLLSLATATLLLPPPLQQVLSGGFPGRI